MYKIIIFLTLFFFTTNNLLAYIGPGMGGGFIAATIGIVLALFAAIFGLIWFPIMRILKKKKKNENKK